MTSVLIAIAGFVVPLMLFAPLVIFMGTSGADDISMLGGLVTLLQIVLAFCGAVLGILLGAVRNKKPVFIVLFSVFGLYFLALAGRVAVSFFLVELRTTLLVFTTIELIPLILTAILLLCAFADYIKIKRSPPPVRVYSPYVVMHTPNSPIPPQEGIPYWQTAGGAGQPVPWQGWQHGQFNYNNHPKDTAFGVVSLVLGIVSLIISCFPFVGFIGILPLIFGIIAVKKKNNMGIAGLVLGIIALVFALLMTSIFFFDSNFLASQSDF